MRGIICTITLAIVLSLSALIHGAADYNGNPDDGPNTTPFFKIGCDMIFRGRADPIVEPGKFSQHSHKVFGGANFDIGNPATSNEDYYNHINSASCTTCSVQADKSNYWIGDLYYRWDNGSISLVPHGGLLVYYLTRTGRTQTHVDYHAFPKGFRMTAGTPTRRSYNSSVISNTAVTWACLSSEGRLGEQHDFATTTYSCDYGLRAQVFFPQCWDGVNLDSPNHQTHVAYPTMYNGGDCPATHPVRLNGIFFEILFDVNDFPHGTATNGVNKFMLSTGDTTGYGLHADFLNGWDVDVLQKALQDPSCYGNNTNGGNDVSKCNTLRPYLKNVDCKLAKPIIATEDIGEGHLIDHLPGCNPQSGAGPNAVPCYGQWPVKIQTSGTITTQRVFIINSDNTYWYSDNSSVPLQTVATDKSMLHYAHVFDFDTDSKTGLTTVYSGLVDSWASASSGGAPMTVNKRSPSTWETFKLTAVGTDSVGPKYTIQAQSNSKYLALTSSGIQATATMTGPTTTFYLIDANAGVADTRTSTAGFPGGSPSPSGPSPAPVNPAPSPVGPAPSPSSSPSKPTGPSTSPSTPSPSTPSPTNNGNNVNGTQAQSQTQGSAASAVSVAQALSVAAVLLFAILA